MKNVSKLQMKLSKPRLKDDYGIKDYLKGLAKKRIENKRNITITINIVQRRTEIEENDSQPSLTSKTKIKEETSSSQGESVFN